MFLTWRANREADLVEYRLWRAESAEALADVRRLTPSAVVTPTVGATEETYTDSGLTGGATYYYRLAAVDTNGNVSDATETQAERAVDTTPPDPPTWVSAEWNAEETAIELEWVLADANHEVLVQRATIGSDNWVSVAGWLPNGTGAYSDATPYSPESSVYRLKVREPSGNISKIYPQINTVAEQ